MQISITPEMQVAGINSECSVSSSQLLSIASRVGRSEYSPSHLREEETDVVKGKLMMNSQWVGHEFHAFNASLISISYPALLFLNKSENANTNKGEARKVENCGVCVCVPGDWGGGIWTPHKLRAVSPAPCCQRKWMVFNFQ